MKSKTYNNTDSQRGIALIMILWVLTILMVLVLSFTYMTRTETDAAISFRDGVAGKFLAEAGVQRGIMEIFYRQNNPQTDRSEVWRKDGTQYKVETDKGGYLVSITDESGKVDINSAPEVILRGLFTGLGLKAEDADIAVDSILDWKDADDLHRLNGAENDYYMSLPNPYKAKNAGFETLEELIMVRGITLEILHGDGVKRGMIDFLTLHSQTGKINLKTAPREVLLAIPGITSEAADAIILKRESGEITENDILGILGQNYSLAAPYVSSFDSGIFTIDALGYKDSEETGYGIRATVSIYKTNQYSYLYYKSPAGVKHDSSQKPAESLNN
ncbi:MAG: general secretion pathway protein GspK [Nitrospirae bacterium]|nr:general secretion pathway protein GspK [Nitrospirota bacterium]